MHSATSKAAVSLNFAAAAAAASSSSSSSSSSSYPGP
jgi:hypothetical protein